MITELKKLLISGMKLGVGITAFVGITSALTPLPVIGKYFGTIKDGAQSLFDFEVKGVPIGPFIGTLGGIGIVTGFYYILTARRDMVGRVGKAAFTPGAAIDEITGTAKKLTRTAKKIVDAV
jgi:hypothetical protein